MITNLAYLVALHSIDGIGPVKLTKLLDYFKDSQHIWQASISELVSAGIYPSDAEKIQQARSKINPEQYLQEITNAGIKIVTIFDSEYPQNLAQIYDPPMILFYKGVLPKAGKPSIAIVGTRKVTGYGRLVTEKFAGELSRAGLTITSGLARGVDTIAHQSAIESMGLTTAVLGGGLLNIYPPENQALVQQIIDTGGAVITEYHPHVLPSAGHFPARNRIIAGLSEAVLVTEAAIDSGSLITARQGLEMGKEVFTIPGPITSQLSLGPAELIKQGATLVTEPLEILESLNIPVKVLSLDSVSISTEDQKILSLLQNETLHIDEICRTLKRPTSSISSSLIKMEIKGLIKNLGGGNYVNIAN